ncbi:MAG: iron-sulfur cluster assembly scaffold protein [Fimbriimonadaceae bacterium]|nr:iron-sulfur cluster assembly scaffold protein [Fimbriimonadaceae bacterium]
MSLHEGFSSVAIQALQSQSFRRKLEKGDLKGQIGDPGGGDYVIFEILLEENIIIDIGFQCNGCPTLIIACEMLASLACKRPLANINEMNENILKKIMGTVPEGKEKYLAFAVNAIKSVLQPGGVHQ